MHSYSSRKQFCAKIPLCRGTLLQALSARLSLMFLVSEVLAGFYFLPTEEITPALNGGFSTALSTKSNFRYGFSIFGHVGSTEKKIELIMSNFGWRFLCFHGQFFLNIYSIRTNKLHNISFIYKEKIESFLGQNRLPLRS